MRLPIVGGDPSRIDEEAATRLLHDAIAAGVNWVDTAWPYHGGQSEAFVGRALQGPWRRRVQLATKCPVWEVRSEGDWDRFLDAQLARLGTERIDFYLMHALDGDRWDTVRRLRGMEAMERARADGRVGHLGFSFHGSLGEFKAIVDGWEWEFCQIQLNLLDVGYQAGVEGMRYAAARGIGVVVMEPLRGGALARVPPDVQALWARSGRPWSAAEWALRWAWHHPEVVTVLSGMNAADQLRENAAAANAAHPLDARDLARVAEVTASYRARMRVGCTTCGYCQPCPSGVAVPDVFSAYDSAAMFGSKAGPAAVYAQFVLKHGAGGDRCTGCGECEPRCPQVIPIPEMLKEAHAFLTSP
jgi:predicted aldo/keto reductase-like oxidoreductase